MRIEVNLGGVKRKMSQSNLDKGQYALANQALADMSPFVPFKEGPLRMSGKVSDNGRALTWNTPYARRHFYAPGGWNYTTPGTGPRWDLKAESLHMKDWERAFLKGADLD